MSDFVSDHYEPLTISATPPGWRALYVDPADQSNFFTRPLIGWAVLQVTVRNNEHQDQIIQLGRQIEGVVLDGSYPVVAPQYAAGFTTYLGPDDPDPDPGVIPVEPGKRKPKQPDKRQPGFRFTPAGGRPQPG